MSSLPCTALSRRFAGFDRFAGIEGLRGMCVAKAVAEDAWPFSTAIPPMLQVGAGVCGCGGCWASCSLCCSRRAGGQATRSSEERNANATAECSAVPGGRPRI